MYNCIICNSNTLPLVNTKKLTDNSNYNLQYRYCNYCFHIKYYILPCDTIDLYQQNWPKIQNYIEFDNYQNDNPNSNSNVVIQELDDIYDLKNTVYNTIDLKYLLCNLDNPSFVLHKIKKYCDNDTILICKSPIFKLNLYNINSNYISFYNINSFRQLLGKHNMFLYNVDKDTNKYTFYFGITNKEDTNINDIIYNELQNDIYDENTYEMYKIKSIIYKNTMDNLSLYNNWIRLNTYNHL